MPGKMQHIRKGELVVLVLCVVILLGSLGAVGTAGRERAKRAVCLSNLRQLTQGWRQFADDRDGQLVNGAAGITRASQGQVDKPWVDRAWSLNWNNPNVADTGFTEEQKKQAIQEGALWPWIGDERVYRCPSARPHEFVNYSIVDAMNGLHRSGTFVSRGGYMKDVGVRVGKTTLWIKNINEIETPPAAERMVFVDEGAITPDSFGVHYMYGSWWDEPPGRHNDGVTVSWADGHATHIKWRAAETIERARHCQDYYCGGGFMPQTTEGIKDLDDFRQAVWGRLGYESTTP